jgi:predicted nucleic acid-binding protein
MFLLDTNVVSELRRPRPHGGVVAWLRSIPEAGLRISAVTLGEIQRGIEITRRRDAAKAREIELWADELERTFAVVAADGAIFRRHARMMSARPDAAYEDALIAATASVLDLSVATRNVADFQGFEVRLFDPFRPAPG